MKRRVRKILRTNLVLVLLLFTWFGNAFMVKAESNSKVIVIDPAFQSQSDDSKEPVGPGAYKTSIKNSSGNVGSLTGYPEYELTLQVALKLQQDLEDAGYDVTLTRTTNDVDISNSGRAMIANMLDADLFVVVSARTDGDSEAGVQVLCQSDDNPYNYGNYSDGRLLSDAILGSVQPNCVGGEVVENDDLAVMNWCQSPSTVVEVGSIVNEEDEKNLVTEEYQQQLADGIAAGIDSYFAQK